MQVNILIKQPTLDVSKDTKDGCRCVMVNIKTPMEDYLHLTFESMDDAKALHGLLGYALGVES